MIQFIVLQNRQGKTRLSKYYRAYTDEAKTKIEGEIHRIVTTRDPKFTNFVEVRARYADQIAPPALDAASYRTHASPVLLPLGRRWGSWLGLLTGGCALAARSSKSTSSSTDDTPASSSRSVWYIAAPGPCIPHVRVGAPSRPERGSLDSRRARVFCVQPPARGLSPRPFRT